MGRSPLEIEEAHGVASVWTCRARAFMYACAGVAALIAAASL